MIKRNSKLYAIKIFNFDYVFKQFSSGSDNRITREINALKAVNHPNVVSYVDDGSFIDNGVNYLYVVMDYVDGEDLSKYIINHTLTTDQAVSIFKSIVMGVNAIHEQRIVHRDLKPANIYITLEGKVKIYKFVSTPTEDSVRLAYETARPE